MVIVHLDDDIARLDAIVKEGGPDALLREFQKGKMQAGFVMSPAMTREPSWRVAVATSTDTPGGICLYNADYGICLTGDTLGSLHCDCGWQLATAMERISKEGIGVLIYLRPRADGRPG